MFYFKIILKIIVSEGGLFKKKWPARGPKSTRHSTVWNRISLNKCWLLLWLILLVHCTAWQQPGKTVHTGLWWVSETCRHPPSYQCLTSGSNQIPFSTPCLSSTLSSAMSSTKKQPWKKGQLLGACCRDKEPRLYRKEGQPSRQHWSGAYCSFLVRNVCALLAPDIYKTKSFPSSLLGKQRHKRIHEFNLKQNEQ